MLERAPKALYDLGVAEKVARLVGGWVGEPVSVSSSFDCLL